MRRQAEEHVQTAAKLIEQTGYHRRDRELAELRAQLDAPVGWVKRQRRPNALANASPLIVLGLPPASPGLTQPTNDLAPKMR